MKKRLFGIATAFIITGAVIAPSLSTMNVYATQNVQNNNSSVCKECAQQKQTVQKGWVYNSSTKTFKYYGNDGKAYTGWHWMTSKEGEKTPHWSYFGNDGILRTGWQQLGKGTNNPDGNAVKHWSYFGDNGWLRTGWQQLGKGTSNPDGNASKHWSYFGDNGWLRTGWQQMGQGTGNPDGNAVKHWSYFGDNGWLRTGWKQLGIGTSNPDGNAAPHWSYFGDNGWLRTGWQNMGKGTSNSFEENTAKHISYFGGDGWLRVGLQDMSNSKNPDGGAKAHKSYFGDNGWLWTNRNTPALNVGNNKVVYKADGRGWLSVVSSTPIPVHTHNWVAQYKTENYTEQEPYTETKQIPGAQVYDTCSYEVVKTIYSDNARNEAYQYAMDNVISWTDANSSHCTLAYRTISPKTETVTKYRTVTKTRQVANGYKCSSCGATK